MLGRKPTEDLLKRVLSLSPADETEAILLGLDEQLTRFANNGIHQHVAERNRYVVVRALKGRRSGVAATNDLTEEGLERLVESASRAAASAPRIRNSPASRSRPMCRRSTRSTVPRPPAAPLIERSR